MSSANSVFFAGFKSPYQQINYYANYPSKRNDYGSECNDCDGQRYNYNNENNDFSGIFTRGVAGYCDTRHQYSRTCHQYRHNPFFIDRLRKPALHVVPLTNTRHIPDVIDSKEKLSVDDSKIYFHEASSAANEHHSQWHSVHWKEKGESPDVFAKPRLAMKFGVIKVTNLPRRVSKLQFCQGIATNLKADVQTLLLGQYSKEGVYSSYKCPWLTTRELSWYKDAWHEIMNMPYQDGSEKDEQALLNELKGMLKNPLSVWKYLRNPRYDMLCVEQEGFLLLFYTVEGHSNFFVDKGQLPLGKYKFKVGIYSNELVKPKEYVYELDIQSWIDWDLKGVKS